MSVLFKVQFACQWPIITLPIMFRWDLIACSMISISCYDNLWWPTKVMKDCWWNHVLTHPYNSFMSEFFCFHKHPNLCCCMLVTQWFIMYKNEPLKCSNMSWDLVCHFEYGVWTVGFLCNIICSHKEIGWRFVTAELLLLLKYCS